MLSANAAADFACLGTELLLVVLMPSVAEIRGDLVRAFFALVFWAVCVELCVRHDLFDQ